MGNLTTKIIQTSIQINGKLQFSHVWDGETSENFIHCFKCKNKCFSDKNIWRDYSPSVYNLRFYQD